MENYYSKKVYDNDLFDLTIQDNALVVNLLKKNSLIISSWHNSGYQENISHVLNQSLITDDYNIIEKKGSAYFQQKRMKELNINPEKATGLITAASMDNYAISTLSYKDLTVTSIVTAGADKNGIKAGDPSSFYEYDNKYQTIIGTINIITIIDANLEPGALTTAIITATEAKSSILQDLKIESQFSSNIATGTGTDGICIISNKESKNHLENAGKHSMLGELIAKTVQNATRDALYLQTNMNADYQKTVLSRLSRFNMTFEDFYKKTDNQDLLNYSSKFYDFNRDVYHISWISSFINLIDEYQSGLLDFGDMKDVAIELVENFLCTKLSCNVNSTEQLLDLLIASINDYILKK